MKIISWNLLHSGGASLADLLALVSREQPDLLLMQEATASIDALPALLGGCYARHPLPGRLHGLAAWSGRHFSAPSAAMPLEAGLLVRRVCQILTLPGLSVANVHLSHGQRLNRRQLQQIFASLPRRAAVLGDCNMLGPMPGSGFRDVGPRRPTHLAGRMLPLRLDRCFIRDLDCQGAVVLPRGHSDHRPIMVRLTPPAAAAAADDAG
jgi:endonuclease/exonuclease/phosphatase (EEP) superfamily protein YafD